MEAALSEFKS